MPKGERLTDAIRYERVDALKKDLFLYIDKNPEKISSSLPVFYGHVISALDNAFPEIDNSSYDQFIDEISFSIMNACPEAKKVQFLEKVIANAMRCKRKKSGRSTLRILSGIKMMDVGRFREALEYFGEYWKYDARIGMYIAYCNYALSENEKKILAADREDRPTGFELEAREVLLVMARVKPPINRLKQLDIRDTESMDRAFWLMIKKSLEWFPAERWFLKIGIEKARHDGNEAKREQLLAFAVERFYNDRDFLRENYYLRIEKKDAIGASGIVKQMIQQNSGSPEPYYYGLKLSLLSGSKSTYNDFRQGALETGMPNYLLQLFDLALFVMREERHEADLQCKQLKKLFRSLHFYLTALEYLIDDIFSDDDPKRKKRSKIVFFESLDRYAMQVLKIQE